MDAAPAASRSMAAVATRPLVAAAEETTIAQHQALVVLPPTRKPPVTG